MYVMTSKDKLLLEDYKALGTPVMALTSEPCYFMALADGKVGYGL